MKFRGRIALRAQVLPLYEERHISGGVDGGSTALDLLHNPDRLLIL